MERLKLPQETDLGLDCDEGENNIPLRDVIAMLQDKLEAIPISERDSAILKVRLYGEYPSVYFNVGWERLETDEEMEARRLAAEKTDARAKKAARKRAKQKELNERAEYERLKAKYSHV